jgi:16S rRNA (guanine527-N7)-methyltransferase
MCNGGGETELNAVLERCGLSLPAEQVQRLDAYRELLWEWNERLNLTRHLSIEAFVTRDVLDSWQLARQLEPGERILDVGTGGGVPGLMLAILRPDLKVSVCESVAKKAKAVAAMVEQLGLAVPVHATRAEAVLAAETFDTLVARAVGPLDKLLKWLQPHWRRFRRLLLIQGPKWTEQRGRARHLGYLASLELRRLASYTTPGHHAASVVLAIYPRSFADRAVPIQSKQRHD